MQIPKIIELQSGCFCQDKPQLFTHHALFISIVMWIYLGCGYLCSPQLNDGTLFLITACAQKRFQKFLPSASAGLLTGWQVNINMQEGIDRVASKTSQEGWGIICRQLATQ